MSPNTAITSELIVAYRATNYQVSSNTEPFVMRIGHRSVELAHLFEQTGKTGAAFITAENPLSQTSEQQENAANRASLREDLAAAGAIILEGAGQGEDRGWPAEASFMAIGISSEHACELGRKYRQNAIVWIGSDAVPELVVLH